MGLARNFLWVYWSAAIFLHVSFSIDQFHCSHKDILLFPDPNCKCLLLFVFYIKKVMSSPLVFVGVNKLLKRKQQSGRPSNSRVLTNVEDFLSPTDMHRRSELGRNPC